MPIYSLAVLHMLNFRCHALCCVCVCTPACVYSCLFYLPLPATHPSVAGHVQGADLRCHYPMLGRFCGLEKASRQRLFVQAHEARSERCAGVDRPSGESLMGVGSALQVNCEPCSWMLTVRACVHATCTYMHTYVTYIHTYSTYIQHTCFTHIHAHIHAYLR